MSVLTTCSVRSLHAVGSLLLVVLAFPGCGGKAQRPPRRTLPPPSVAPPPPSSPSTTAPADDVYRALAPAPVIRIGLATSAEAIRVTSSRPFRIGAGSEWIASQDVLVTRSLSDGEAGFVFRVQLGSFPSESAAGSVRARLSEELGRDLSAVREAATGRWAVRYGSYSTESGARQEAMALAAQGFDSPGVVREPGGASRPSAISLVAAGRAPLQLPPTSLVAVVPEQASAFIEVDGNPYRGYVEIALASSGRFLVRNVVSLEAYLRGVVPAELSPEVFPEKEALKSQAIAARTYAVKHLGEFESEGYDLCATPACQVYRGVSVERPLSDAAVRETSGEVLTYDGELVDALYTSTCGGRTENAENVFSTAEPYLVSRACLLESRMPVVEGANDGPLSLEAAALVRLGIVEERATHGSASASEARRWIEDALRHLGQTACWDRPADAVSGGGDLDFFELGALLGEALCWQRRLPFLLSPKEAERIVGTRAPERGRTELAFALREGLIVPDEDGIRTGRALDRRSVIASLYRLLTSRGEPLLDEARIRRASPEGLVLSHLSSGGEDSEVSMSFAPVRYLYRDVEGAVSYAPELTLLPDDHVRFHDSDDGIDLLVLDSDGTSFDRSSRFSHWVVRKSAEDLTREVNLRYPVGDVVELLPIRYGRSGRIAELEVVGRDGRETLKGLAIRRALGLRENLFFFDRQQGSDGRVTGWVFTGRGWGHGVGLCQVGAYGMAAAGYGYRDILEHYYPGTTVTRQSVSSTEEPE